MGTPGVPFNRDGEQSSIEPNDRFDEDARSLSRKLSFVRSKDIIARWFCHRRKQFRCGRFVAGDFNAIVFARKLHKLSNQKENWNGGNELKREKKKIL